jgi:hypothetical protein
MQLHDSSFEYTDCTNKDDGVENFTCAAMEKKVFSSIGNGNAMVFDMKLLCEIVIQTCTK